MVVQRSPKPLTWVRFLSPLPKMPITALKMGLFLLFNLSGYRISLEKKHFKSFFKSIDFDLIKFKPTETEGFKVVDFDQFNK